MTCAPSTFHFPSVPSLLSESPSRGGRVSARRLLPSALLADHWNKVDDRCKGHSKTCAYTSVCVLGGGGGSHLQKKKKCSAAPTHRALEHLNRCGSAAGFSLWINNTAAADVQSSYVVQLLLFWFILNYWIVITPTHLLLPKPWQIKLDLCSLMPNRKTCCTFGRWNREFSRLRRWMNEWWPKARSSLQYCLGPGSLCHILSVRSHHNMHLRDRMYLIFHQHQIVRPWFPPAVAAAALWLHQCIQATLTDACTWVCVRGVLCNLPLWPPSLK